MSASSEESLDLWHGMPNHSNSTQDVYAPAFGRKKYGCSHYERRCAWVSPCCSKVYSCRFCHDSHEKHKINRHAVSEIVCLMCDTRQPVNRFCVACGIEFGKYFCPICRLFDDKDKKQFHCDQCGFCRVYGRENFFHCPTCDICLCIDIKDTHKCIEKVGHANCSVCLEDLHTSRDCLSVLSCGHITHRKCFRNLLRSGIYTCPLCCRTMIDMNSAWHSLDLEISNTPMPDEYRDIYVAILCRDCHKISSVPFHVIGLKCRKCGSYNTCRSSSSSCSTESDDDNRTSASGSTRRASSSDEGGSTGAWTSADLDDSSSSVTRTDL